MPKRSSRKTAAATCACGSSVGECPECGKLYRHGTASHCTAPSCRAVNAAIDCKGCGRVVSENNDGVLDFDQNLVPWKTASVKIEKRQKSAALEYVELGGACDDCVIAIANDDYSGMDDEQEAATRAGLERIGEWLVVGDELGFEHNRCVVCGGLPGNRHEVGYLEDAGDAQDTGDLLEHLGSAAKKAAQKRPVKFRTLNVGDEFDFSANEYQSFYDRCVKTGPRTYQSLETLTQYRVGSIDAMVNDLGNHDTSADFV